MGREPSDQHLSEITTAWTVFGAAHAGEAGPPGGPAQAEARARLLRSYGTAVYRYLLGSLRDRDAADELFQEFALRLVRGDFHRADPAKGRFRDYLKTALFRLIVDTQRRRRPGVAGGGNACAIALEPAAPGPETPGDEAERKFLDAWRAELLARAWEALDAHEKRTGQPVHTVLKLRTDHPEMRSPEMAEQLSERLGRTLNAIWVRKKLLLARATYTGALLDAVALSLADPTRENLEQELIDLGLHGHCREALDGRTYPPGPGPG